MHEFSIAESVFDIAKAQVPDGAVLRGVTMEAGPMRGIEPAAMRWAWQALVGEDIALRLVILPWRVRCRDCETLFSTDDPLSLCSCGSENTHPEGGDELRLIAIDVDERTSPCASRSLKTS